MWYLIVFIPDLCTLTYFVCRTDIYLFPLVKNGRTCAMLNFNSICFLKVGNVDIFLKLSSREFHSLTVDGNMISVKY